MSRSVLVTGGNRGIGLAVARAFAEEGDKVAVTYRSGEPPAGLFGVRCDVTDPASVRSAFEEVRTQQGRIEVLVASAGINDEALVLGMEEERFGKVIETNLAGAFRCAKEASRDMVVGRWGRIIFISSTVGFTGSPGQANYAASKAGLMGLARSLAWELGGRNITVNVVAPGYIDTDMTKEIPQPRKDFILSQVPLRRMGTVEEVAGMVRFLTGASADYVTGAVIPISGGLGMGH